MKTGEICGVLFVLQEKNRDFERKTQHLSEKIQHFPRLILKKFNISFSSFYQVIFVQRALPRCSDSTYLN